MKLQQPVLVLVSRPEKVVAGEPCQPVLHQGACSLEHQIISLQVSMSVLIMDSKRLQNGRCRVEEAPVAQLHLVASVRDILEYEVGVIWQQPRSRSEQARGIAPRWQSHAP